MKRAIRMALDRDAKADPATRMGAALRVSRQLGINVDTLRGWVTPAEIDRGTRAGTTSVDAARVAALARELRAAATPAG